MNVGTSPLTKKVTGYIEKYSLVEPGDRMLVAFSGGRDSHCLLMILKSLYPKISAVYVNHQLRGKESEREEVFVRERCAELKIPLFVEKLTWGKKRGNLEEEARKKRYRHIAKVAKEEGFQKVALAHHRDDLVETFLLRLIRGSGPAALIGMKPRRGAYIRPLIDISGKEIEDFMTSNQLLWFTDSSNTNLEFSRNWIRNKLIPDIMHRLNPDFPETAVRTMRWLEEQQQLISEFLETKSGMIQRMGNDVAFSRESFLDLSHPLRKAFIKKILIEQDPNVRLNSRVLEKMTEAVEKQENMELPGILMIESLGDSVRFRLKSFTLGYYEIDVPGAGIYPFPPGNVALHFSVSESTDLPAKPGVATLDAEKASFPLYIRNWKKGDQFYPLGMKGRKKLSDFWIDQKVPRERRKRIPLIFKNEDLIAIGDLRIDDRFKITGSTKKVLRIEVQENHV